MIFTVELTIAVNIGSILLVYCEITDFRKELTVPVSDRRNDLKQIATFLQIRSPLMVIVMVIVVVVVVVVDQVVFVVVDQVVVQVLVVVVVMVIVYCSWFWFLPFFFLLLFMKYFS